MPTKDKNYRVTCTVKLQHFECKYVNVGKWFGGDLFNIY